MAEDTDVTSFDAQVNGAWAEFEGALAAQIGRLRDGQILGIEVDVPEQQDGASPYVQVLAFDEDGVRCEVSSNYFLAQAYQLDELQDRLLQELAGFALDHDDAGEPDGNYYLMTTRDDAAAVADAAVQALRLGFNVLHPAMLSEQGGVDPAQVPLPDPADMEPLDLDSVHEVADPWDVMHLVHRTLYAATGRVIDRDDDGDWPLLGLAPVPIYVSVRSDHPVVRVWARFVTDVSDRDAALREVNILNRGADRVRFHFGHDALWGQYEVTCWPFVPRHLQLAVDVVASAAKAVSGDFALRTGGEAP